MNTIVEVNTPVARGDVAAASAVSWPAIFAGAAAAASLSLILVMLGTGLGLSSVSPWAYEGVTAETFGVGAIVWTILTSIAASAMGGYIAGRLRVRWLTVHIDEVHFRDTAHGFLAWSVATLATAALLAGTIGTIVGAGAKAGATIAGGAAATAGATIASAASGEGDDFLANTEYYADQLMRRSSTPAAPMGAAPSAMPSSPTPTTSADPSATTDASTGASTDMAGDTTATGMDAGDNRRGWSRRAGGNNAEAGRILAHALGDGELSAGDTDYLASIVAERTGMTQAEARTRVTQTYTAAQQAMQRAEATAKQVADEARKAAAHAALWLFIALLIGAFTASFMATVGGRQRDL